MPQTTYNSSNCKDAVWELAKPVRGCDADRVRQDPYGNRICYNSYGKSTAMGWDIDHIKPQSRGGSDNIRNLQALQSSTNRSKQDSLVKKSRHNG
jgi:hypothetical protein